MTKAQTITVHEVKTKQQADRLRADLQADGRTINGIARRYEPWPMPDGSVGSHAAGWNVYEAKCS